MRKIILLSTALSVMASSAFAQTGYNKVVKPVSPTVDDIINAPIEYDENGVVQAQYFSADDLSDAEYKALLDEADRIRAYQSINGVSQTSVDIPQTSQTVGTQYGYSNGYQVEMVEPDSFVTAVAAPKIHTIAKGDTLYNLSKRYDASIAAIQAENGLTGTALNIGQQIRIPGVVSSSLNTTILQPIFANAPEFDGTVTRRVVEPQPIISQSTVEATTQIYAVLPKDTLYSIARRTCTKVDDLIDANGIANPNALSPGQRLALPTGHCLAK